MQNQKDILFYSNFCEFSKNIINAITKHNLRSIFLFICVDEGKYQIPQFIDSVPTILKRNGEVFKDEQLMIYVESKFKTDDIQEEIAPMVSQYGNSLYSTNFASIDGDDSSIENRNYLSLGREQHMIHVEDSQTSSKKSADSDSAFEKLMQNRKLEDSQIKKALGGGQHQGRI